MSQEKLIQFFFWVGGGGDKKIIMVFPRVANRVDRYFGRYLGRLSVYISVAISADYQSRVRLGTFQERFFEVVIVSFCKNPRLDLSRNDCGRFLYEWCLK